ncbi:MAG: hypothetical protein H5U36_02985 [Candidatus Caldatribacterium sp.]|nr:hypothetical protein [Candidatus Caldatribacterium sp.]
MKQGFYFFLFGLFFLFVSCQIQENLEIVNPPPYLLCGARHQFLVSFSPRLGRFLSWDARYGFIDSSGLYQAPDFPCQEVVGVRALGMRREVTFPVVRDMNGEATQEVPPFVPAFRILVEPPPLVASRQVSFSFAVRGSFSVILNGIVLQKGFHRMEEEVTLSLLLEEGENLLLVLLEGKEVFRKHILCDTTPPEVSLSRAVAVQDGVRVSGTATEEVTLEFAKASSREWAVTVPWHGEKRVVFKDRAGNRREEVFSVERDVRLEVQGPSQAKLGQKVSFLLQCQYRNVPLEGEVWCGDERIVLEEGEGMFSTKFWEEGKIPLSFCLGKSIETTVLVEVCAPSVAFLSVTSKVPEEVVAGEPLVVEGVLEDADGDPCPRREVHGEISSVSSPVLARTVSDDSGRWCLTFEGLSGFGERTLRLQSGEREWQKEFYLVSGRPVSFLKVRPTSNLQLVAGWTEPFTVKALTGEGKPVSGAKVEWMWRGEEGTYPVPPGDLSVNERTGISGECSGEIAMPRKVGTYTLEARLSFFDLLPVSWKVTVLPAAPYFFEDLSSLPAQGKVGEPLSFTVQVRDLFGNPCPGKTVNVYRKVNDTLTKVLGVTTDAEGKASFSLVPQEVGELVLEAYVAQTSLPPLAWSIPIST